MFIFFKNVLLPSNRVYNQESLGKFFFPGDRLENGCPFLSSQLRQRSWNSEYIHLLEMYQKTGSKQETDPSFRLRYPVPACPKESPLPVPTLYRWNIVYSNTTCWPSIQDWQRPQDLGSLLCLTPTPVDQSPFTIIINKTNHLYLLCCYTFVVYMLGPDFHITLTKAFDGFSLELVRARNFSKEGLSNLSLNYGFYRSFY